MVSFFDGRNLYDGKEKTELADGVGNILVVDGLGDVDVAAQFVAALDLLLVVRRRENNDGCAFDMGIFLDPLQDIDPGHVRQIEVEQNQQRLVFMLDTGAIVAEQIFHRICTVGERNDFIVDAGAPDVSFDQTGVTFVVLDHDDFDSQAHSTFPCVPKFHCAGRVTVKVLPS